jgi:hypothetical protein
LARFELPPLEYAVAAGEGPNVTWPAIDSNSVHLQALVPRKDMVLLRAMNYSDQPARAKVRLPPGWHLRAQVDAYGTPYREQPRGESIRLGAWEFGTFELVR